MTTQDRKPKRATGVTSTGTQATGADQGHRNEVVVRGRLSTAAVMKELPSGEEIVNWRLAVDRGTVAGGRQVDLVDCTTSGARLRRQALGWHEGDVIEVAGALRRRFWRGTGGLQSRCEVEVDTATKQAGAGRRRPAVAALSRPRTPA